MVAELVIDSQFRARLERGLRSLQALDGVVGTVVATRDGAVVASGSDDTVMAQTLAATTAAICGRLADVAHSLGLGRLNAVLTDTSTHTIQFMPIGSAVLCVITRRHHAVRPIREAMRGIAVAFEHHPALAGPPPAPLAEASAD